LAVSKQRVATALSAAGFQRGIAITGTPGYQVDKDAQTGDPVVSVFVPNEGDEQPATLEQYQEAIESAGLQVTMYADAGQLVVMAPPKKAAAPTVTAGGSNGTGASAGPSAEGGVGAGPTTGTKVSTYWQTHDHPLKGKNLTEGARSNISNKLHRRQAVIKMAVGYFQQALGSGAATLSDLPEGMSDDEAMTIINEVASAEAGDARKRYQIRARERKAAARAQNGASAPAPAAAAPTTGESNDEVVAVPARELVPA
jgi:hypothetical protein